MALPEGTRLTQTSFGGEGLGYEVAAEDRSWTMSVQVRTTKSAEATIFDTAKIIMEQAMALRPLLDPRTGQMTHTAVQLVHREGGLRVPGSTSAGARLYFLVPAQNAKASAPTAGASMKGYTVFKPLATQFVIFELTSSREAFETARAAYELSIATLKLEDPQQIMAERRAALIAGTEFIQTLSAETLTAAMPAETRFFRLHTGGGAQEVGYRSVSFKRGRRSDLTAATGEPGGSLTRDDPQGLLVTIKGRVLRREPAGLLPIDTQTVAFLALDRTNEAWVTSTAVREGKGKPAVASEIGARAGRSLSVVVRESGKPDQAVQHALQGEAYLSVVEVQMLPQLLALGKVSGEVGYYAYRADGGVVSLRRDRVEALGQGLLKISSRLRDGEDQVVSTISDRGELVKTELVGGLVWEAVELDELMALWKSQRLPMGN